MHKIRIEAIFTLIGMLISIIFIINPHPYVMFAFVFIAQPAFAFAIISALIQVYRDLKSKEVI